jgi:hypothetical protein
MTKSCVCVERAESDRNRNNLGPRAVEMESSPGDDDPLTLKEACEILFRGGTLDHSRVLAFGLERPDPPIPTFRLGPAVSCGAFSRGAT